MGFLVYCDNKGCGKHQEPLLDKETNEVSCSECGEIIKNVTHFAKASMRAMNQFKRKGKNQETFAVKCDVCKKTARPNLNQDVLFCPFCGKEHTSLQSVYAYAVKQHIMESKKNGK